jgi:ABC-2 type transport system permease protein
MTEGFQLMSRMSENSSSGLLKSFNLLLSEFGIYAHYKSMSRGVIDTRDVVYFLSANIFFILCTLTVLRKRNW